MLALRRLASGLLAGLTILAVACGPQPMLPAAPAPNSTATAPTAVAGAPASSSAAPAAAAASPATTRSAGAQAPGGTRSPREGGSIVMGGGKDDGIFNAILFPRSSCICNSLIYSSLFRLNSAGTDVEGDLVDRWSITPDGLSYTITLRANAVWHDGQPVTGEDVVFTFDQIRDPKNGSSWVALLAGLDSYRATGPKEVQFSLRQPTPALVSRLMRVGILPKHLLAGEPTLTASTFNQKPVGSGPFKVESYAAGVQLVLLRNDQYYLGRPRLDRITYRFLADPTAATLGLKSGEIDLARLSSANVPSLTQAANVVVQQFPTNGQGGVQFNLRNPTLADQRVREALSYALDREAIAKGVFAGVGQVEQAPIASTSPFFSPDFTSYPYDPKRSADLLTAAGWIVAGDGVRTKDGQSLALAMNVNSESATSGLAAQAIQAQFKAVGVTVNLRVTDFATWRDLLFNKKEYDLIWTAFGSPLDPDDTEYNKYQSESPGNVAGLKDPTIDQLLERGRHGTDPVQRKQVYAEYQQRMTQLLPLLFVGYDRVILGASSRLQGLSVRPVGYDGNAYLDNAHLWWVD